MSRVDGASGRVAWAFGFALAGGFALLACSSDDGAPVPEANSGGAGGAGVGGAGQGASAGSAGAQAATAGLGGTTAAGAGTAGVSGATSGTGAGGNAAAGGSSGHAGADGGSGAGSGGNGAGAGGGGVGGMAASGGATQAGAGGLTGGDGGTQSGSGGSAGQVNTSCPYEGGVEPNGEAWVNGELIEFNDDGGWCWYQDERVIVDEETRQLIIGSVASRGGRARRVEVTHWDLDARTSERHHIGTMGYTDDHDVPAIVKKPDGGYVAMWAGHNDDCNSYYSVYDGDSWSNSASFAWPQCPTSSGKRITYANLWYLDGTLYSYVRSIDTSPHHLHSEDGGSSWTLGGRLTSTPQVGYVAGYYKYWGDNRGRLDFLGTEAHPRDNDNSLYHGYIEDGKIHRSTGEVVDTDFSDRSANEVSDYTKVFATGTTVNGVRLEHLWNADLVRYDDGSVAAIGTARVSGTGSTDPDKRLLYFRFDGTRWTTTYLAKAGTKLYGSEQDYTGLGALHPDDPEVIYISTPYDPRSDEGEFDGKKEIWKGVTCDGGATFAWEPVTANSRVDNLRPVVPKWGANKTALLWLRGTYTSAQSYDFKVVGLIEEGAN